MDLDTRTLRGIYAIEKQNHGDTVFSTLQLQSTEHNKHRRQYKRPRRNSVARPAYRRTKTDSICKQISVGYRKKYANNELELLAVVRGLERFRLYIYSKPIKLLTDHQASEPLIYCKRSNKTYSARLIRWLDRLPHFTIDVNHIAGKHLALTDYLIRNPNAPPQRDEAYEGEYVINSIVPHYEFVSKVGCLSNHLVQSQSHSETPKGTKSNKQQSTENEREQNAINSIDRITTSSTNRQNQTDIKVMNAKTIDNLEKINNSQETINLIERWRTIVKPGIYRLSNGKWKKYHEPKFLLGERREIEERLSEIIRKIESPAREIRNRPYQQQLQSDEYTADWQFTSPAPQNFR